MKAPLACLVLLLAALSCVAKALEETPYVSWNRHDNAEDRIVIERVETSGNYEIGDMVVVSGHYKLNSLSSATLAAYVTQTEGDGSSQTLPGQSVQISQGEGSFRLSLYIRHKGWPHVSLYPAEGGSSIASVYFGNEDQVAAASNALSGSGKG
ncbi:MAG: hypothetical protein ACQKBV_06665 [Puniceicoccales bacterium]